MTYCHFLKGGSSSFFSFHHLSGGNGLKSSNFYPGNVNIAALQGHENDLSVDSFLQLCPYQKTLCLSQKVFSLQKSSDPNWFLTTTIQLSKDHYPHHHPSPEKNNNNHPIGPPQSDHPISTWICASAFSSFNCSSCIASQKNGSQWPPSQWLLAKNITPSAVITQEKYDIAARYCFCNIVSYH